MPKMSTDTREKILSEIKDIILSLKIHGDRIKDNKIFRDKWLEKSNRLKGLGDTLSTEDRDWMDKELLKWYKNIL